MIQKVILIGISTRDFPVKKVHEEMDFKFVQYPSLIEAIKVVAHQYAIFIFNAAIYTGIYGMIKLVRLECPLAEIYLLNWKNSDSLLPYSSGVDHIISKTTTIFELRQRLINSSNLLQAMSEHSMESKILLIKNMNVVVRNRIYCRLSKREFLILEYLFNANGSVVAREEISKAECKVRCIDAHICNLRRKIHKIGLTVETVQNKGYRIKEYNAYLLAS